MGVPLTRPAPRRPVGDDGRFELGSFRGGFGDVDYTPLAGVGERWLREKRWLWYCLVREPWLVALAVVRTGYASSGFLFVQRGDEPRLRYDLSQLAARSQAEVERREYATVARLG